MLRDSQHGQLMETKLFPCLIDMRFKGVRVDLEKASKIKKDLIRRENKILKRMKNSLGGSDKQISEY